MSFEYENTCPYIDKVLTSVKNMIENEFDDLRDINSEMRSAAEKQIAEKQWEIERLEDAVKDKELTMEILEEKVAELEERIKELEAGRIRYD